MCQLHRTSRAAPYCTGQQRPGLPPNTELQAARLAKSPFMEYTPLEPQLSVNITPNQHCTSCYPHSTKIPRGALSHFQGRLDPAHDAHCSRGKVRDTNRQTAVKAEAEALRMQTAPRFSPPQSELRLLQVWLDSSPSMLQKGTLISAILHIYG